MMHFLVTIESAVYCFLICVHSFPLDERQMKPALCWRSLKGVLWALLRGASLLQKLSLIAVPCRLDPVFKLVLNHPAKPLRALDSPPLHCLRSASLNRSDISLETVIHIVNTCRPLSHLDLSGCWALTLSDITKLQCKAKRRRHTLQITWTWAGERKGHAEIENELYVTMWFCWFIFLAFTGVYNFTALLYYKKI